jgi:HD-like signal output (HDOD) protein
MSWFRVRGRKGSDPASGDDAADSGAEAPETAPETAPGTAPGIAPETAPESAGVDGAEAENDAPVQRTPPAELADLFLVMEEHLTEVELDDARVIVDALKQPPALIDRISSGLDDPDALKEAITASPTLSAAILRVVNSAAFALRAPISSIEHAVTYLGTNMVKGLVLQSSVADVMTFSSDVQRAAYMRLWRASYVASAVAQQYAQTLALEQPSVIATRALLANIGALALISQRPDLAQLYAPKSTLLTRVAAEQEAIMANSALLSALLVREWGLPDALYDALRHVLTPLSWPPDRGERSIEEQRGDVLLYLATRVGDAVAFGGLRDVSRFDVLGQEDPAFFYLPEYLRRCELGGLLPALQEPATAKRIQRLIDTFGD